jgi:vitamin B12 transporter
MQSPVLHARCMALFISFVSSQVMAQPVSEAMEVITVSATPININDAGSSVSVISRQNILDRNAGSVQDLLREIPGFSVNQQGSHGAVTQVRIRGAEANQVLVLINGIEVNDLAQGSEFDFSQISTNDIERIEIVRGPQSALWGSDAMAGVIHIITMPNTDDSSFDASLETGSFSTQRATFSANLGSSRHQTKLSVDYLDSDGTNIARNGNEDDGLENLTVSLAGRYAASDNLSLSYTIRHTDKTSEFDAIDFFTTGLPVDADYETDSTYLYSGVSITQIVSDSIDHSLKASRTDTDNKTSASNPDKDETSGVRDTFRYQFNYLDGANHLSLRVEHETEEYKQRGTSSFFGDPNQNLDAKTDSFAAEYRYVGERFNYSLSGRHDKNSEFDDSNSWRMTGNFKLSQATLFASVGESIKNPTFTERFGFFTNFIGNPDLEPEESLHWEIGARTSLLNDKLELAATYFNADLENEINGFVFDAGTGGFTSGNIDGESKRKGVELAFGYTQSERFDLRATYTYLDATQQGFNGSDVTEVRRPEHTGSLTMNYRWQQAGLNFSVSYTGTQEDNFFPPFPPFQERVELNAFTLVSLSGYYNLNDLVTVTARIENIADEDYEQVYGFASPGVGGHLGFRLKW